MDDTKNFIEAFVEADLAPGGRFAGQTIHTRFPPEPNGYLHIGHCKALCIDFGTAEKFGGICNLRMDDTNPSKEDNEFVEAIQEDIHWLGFDWDDRFFFGSDYFEKDYEYAVELIKKGLAYVCELTPEQFKEFFGAILAEGFDIVHIDISSELSCTCQNAVLAAQELTGQGQIHVVDSRQLSTGGGLLALQGAKLRDSGMTAADIAAELRRLTPCSDTSFVLDTLEFMWKGGRCSGVTALGANMLKLKPCLEMREGKLAVCKKYRGAMEKVYRQYITERLADKTVVADHAFITHSGEVAEGTLQELTKLVRELAPFQEVFVTQAGCTVSSHCGPGTLGVLFLRQPEQ